jgi:hypothetical protein
MTAHNGRSQLPRRRERPSRIYLFLFTN